MRRPRVLLSCGKDVAAILGDLLAGAVHATESIVESRRVSDVKAMFGRIASREINPARTRIGGTLVSRALDESAQVKAGDVIGVVSDEKFALQYQSLDGQLSALESQLANAKFESMRL